MKVRPKLKLELTQTDKTIEIIGWLLIFAVCFFDCYKLPKFA